jgi:MFS family permease
VFAAYGLGAPAGASLYAAYGFSAIAAATTIAPLLSLLLVAPLAAVAPAVRPRSGLRSVFAAVWLPGIGLALASTGLGAVTAFVSLLFAARGWTVWPAFTAFAAALMLARALLGHLADKIGGARVALVFVLIQAAGLALLWLAPGSAVALIGAALTGFGYSLVYPAFGVEAVRRAPPESRGLAMAAYTAFLDVALGVASPALGLVAAAASLNAVFLVGALAALVAAAVAMRLLGMSSTLRSKGLTRGTQAQRIAALCPRSR